MRKILLFTMGLSLLFLSQTIQAQSFEQFQKILASDGFTNDQLGFSIAISNNTALVSSHLDDDRGGSSGSAYIFELQNNVWVQTAKLTASDGAGIDQFGRNLDLDGNRAIIGSLFDDDNGGNSGSAYIFERMAGVWTQVAKLVASDAATNDNFGFNVAIDGNFAIVGALNNDDNGANSGSAYIFEFQAGNWVQVQKLIASNAASGDNFGLGVDIQGNTAVVSARGANGNVVNSGAAYVYELNAGTWVETAILTSSDGIGSDFFGQNISMDGNTIVVGDNRRDEGGNNDAGAAYVFERPLTGWSGFIQESAKLTASDKANADRLGDKLRISGNRVLVGSLLDDDFGGNSGSVYLYEKPITGWAGIMSETQKILPNDGNGNDHFSRGIGIDGEKILIGAPQDDDLGVNSGSAYYFTRPLLTITNDDPSIEDPCSCFNPGNYLLDGQLYFHELVTINGSPGETWEMLNPLNSGSAFDNAGNPLVLPQALTHQGGGVYTIEFWHLPNVGYDANYDRTAGGGPFPLSIGNSCTDCNNIPTTSEWGLIIFGLLLACAGIMVLRRRRFLSYEL